MVICEKSKCMACMACVNICPVSAIEMKEENGCNYPYINENICIHCDKCRNVCQNNVKIDSNKVIQCYAGWSNDENDKKTSASGGIASVLMRYFFDIGAVYASVFDSSLGEFCHKKLKTQSDIELAKGSKYVQCYMGGVYKEIQKDLSDGKQVLFIGTPCEVVAVKQAVCDKDNNLFSVDLVCHGAPPQGYLRDFLKKYGPISNITFRKGDECTLRAFGANDRLLYCNSYATCSFYLAFLKGYTHRESCYTCPYACANRNGDLTIGDFWGVNRDTLVNKYDGRISLILSNTDNGEKLLQCLNEKITLEKRQIEEALVENEQLSKPSRKPNRREEFLKFYPSEGFKAIRHTNITILTKYYRARRILSKIKRSITKKYNA